MDPTNDISQPTLTPTPIIPTPIVTTGQKNTNTLRIIFIGSFAIIFLLFFSVLAFTIINKNSTILNKSNQQNKTAYVPKNTDIEIKITPMIVKEKPSKEIYIDIKNQLKQAFK